MRHAFGLVGLTLVTGCGISVPSYVEPKSPATLEPGFHDFAQQQGRWLCEVYDFALVDTAKGQVVVELNNDYVVRERKDIAGGGLEYRLIFTDMFLGDESNRTTIRLLVPPSRGDDLVVITEELKRRDAASGNMIVSTTTKETEKQLCPAVAPVVVLR